MAELRRDLDLRGSMRGDDDDDDDDDEIRKLFGLLVVECSRLDMEREAARFIQGFARYLRHTLAGYELLFRVLYLVFFLLVPILSRQSEMCLAKGSSIHGERHCKREDEMR